MKYLLLLFIGLQLTTIVDSRDGFNYHLVSRGDQTWIAENIRYKLDSGVSYQPKNYFENYGSYYSHIASFNACPHGFHIPSKDEWIKWIDQMNGIENDLQGKVVPRKELEQNSLLLGGIGRKDTAFMTNTVGFYWTSSDTLKPYFKAPEEGNQRHIIGIHIWQKDETDSFNIEPTYMLAKGRENTLAISCKCIQD
ncbi:FISUMP domain-containing protein [Ekhidna sp. To15]|uniref:FISUMP domain-containing protein n=1 Tax=Ekhidna sp. To15 TaxID=3395267 RepID=UPI003F524CF5